VTGLHCLVITGLFNIAVLACLAPEVFYSCVIRSLRRKNLTKYSCLDICLTNPSCC